MEINIFESRLYMIVETPPDFYWDFSFTTLSTLNLQTEWEEDWQSFNLPGQELLLQKKMDFNGTNI